MEGLHLGLSTSLGTSTVSILQSSCGSSSQSSTGRLVRRFLVSSWHFYNQKVCNYCNLSQFIDVGSSITVNYSTVQSLWWSRFAFCSLMDSQRMIGRMEIEKCNWCYLFSNGYDTVWGGAHILWVFFTPGLRLDFLHQLFLQTALYNFIVINFGDYLGFHWKYF